MNNSEKPVVYYSHPISGAKFDGKTGAPANYEQENCEQAVLNVWWLRKWFPEVDWYCPGEVETPMRVARKLGLLNVKQVLDIDFYILEHECNASFCHKWEQSKGVDLEYALTKQLGYPAILFEQTKFISFSDISKIREFVNQVVTQKKEVGQHA